MKKYLPIGSVVTLKEQTKKIMIIGRSQICEGVLYDYSACPFPEGYLGSTKIYVFNNEDIENLYYVGMQNEEEFAFRNALIKAEENAKSQKDAKADDDLQEK